MSIFSSGIHSMGILNVLVTGGSGQTDFSTSGFYRRIMIAISPPTGSPTFSYYIKDTVTSATIDSQINKIAPATFLGTVPYVNPMTIFFYSTSIDGNYQVVNYIEK